MRSPRSKASSPPSIGFSASRRPAPRGSGSFYVSSGALAGFPAELLLLELVRIDDEVFLEARIGREIFRFGLIRADTALDQLGQAILEAAHRAGILLEPHLEERVLLEEGFGH